MKLHPLLRPLRTTRDEYVRDVLIDLTVYLASFDKQQLDGIIDWYKGVCPQDACRYYMIEENTVWDSVSRPLLLTNLGRARAGTAMPFLEPVRKRIDDGRRFHIQFWDGKRTGAWSLCVRAMHRRDADPYVFARLMAPIDLDVERLHRFALEWTDLLDLRSGHGGLCFSYDQWHLDLAFDDIYARARRFWGIEIEHLNGTLPLMTDRIKGVSWLTLLGRSFSNDPNIATALSEVAQRPDVAVEVGSGGTVIRIGKRPVEGDQNRPDASLEGYEAVARALESLFLDSHPDFPGNAFEINANTLGWIRRFLNPAGWR